MSRDTAHNTLQGDYHIVYFNENKSIYIRLVVIALHCVAKTQFVVFVSFKVKKFFVIEEVLRCSIGR